MRPTALGFGFIAMYGLLYIASMQSESGLLFIVLGIIISLAFINIFYAYKSINSLSFDSNNISHAVEGGTFEEPCKIINHSKNPVGFAKFSIQNDVFLKAGVLEPKTTLSVFPEKIFLRRGVYDLTHLTLSSTFPFGLISCSKKMQSQGEIIVYPKVYECEPPPAAGYEPVVGGSFGSSRKTSSGADFAGTRPMQAQDPVKMIHWKSSAKGQGLMVKEFEEELSGRIGLIIDTCGLRLKNNFTTFDWASRAACSLILSALDTGQHVELIDPIKIERLIFPPFADGAKAREYFARFITTTQPLTKKNLEESLHKISSKASICFILCHLTEDIVEAANTLINQKKRISIYLPGGEFAENSIKQLSNHPNLATLTKLYEAEKIITPNYT